MDYYNTLGVARNATKDDIKKAYRKLAGKHHPDRGGDEAEFKKIQEAYDTLSDEQKRSQYDNPQPEFRFTTNGPFGDFGDFFSQFGGARRQQTYRNPDAVVDMHVDLKDIYHGKDMIVDVGYARELVHVPAGARDGTKIRIHGKGHSRFKESPPGDLVVRIHSVCPPGVSRTQDDVYQRLTISALDAIIGTEVNLEHISGKVVKIKIPKGSQHGSKLRLSGWGMNNSRNNIRGDLYVVLDITIPNITRQDHIDMLNTINKEVKG